METNYYFTKEQLINLESLLDEIISDINDLADKMNLFIIVDSEIVEKKTVNSVLTELDNIKKEIEYSIIPVLNQHIFN